MLLLIALSSFTTIALAVVALAQRPPDPVRIRARALGEVGPTGDASDGGDFAARVLQPVSRAITRLMPHRWLTRLDQMLLQAGEPMELSTFLVIWLFVAAGAAVFGFFLSVPAAFLFGFLGAALPYYLLRRRVKSRQKTIRNALPDALDLLVTCVEAGLGLDAALVRVGEATEGPLGDEISQTLREMAVGRSRYEALLELGTRSGVRDLDSFIRPIVQAERSGVSIATAMRVQADELRVRRRQRAEEAARKIPVKMAMVTAMFFVPATLVVSGAAAITALIAGVTGGFN